MQILPFFLVSSFFFHSNLIKVERQPIKKKMMIVQQHRGMRLSHLLLPDTKSARWQD